MEGVGSLCSGFMPPSLSFWATFTGIVSPPDNISRQPGLRFIPPSSLPLQSQDYFLSPPITSAVRRTQSTLDSQLLLNIVEVRYYSIVAELLFPYPSPPFTMDLDLHDPDNDALTRFPIPQLAEDLSNYYAWQHALYFHLRYHGVFYFITGHEQSRWDLRWQCGDDDDGNPNPPTKHDRKNYQRRNMHAYAILFSKIGNIVPALLAAGWDGDKDSFGFRTDLLWNRVQELRQREQQDRDRDRDRAASHLGTNHSMSSRAISLTDDE